MRGSARTSATSGEDSVGLVEHQLVLVADAKILVIDIETAPNLAYVWGLFNQNIGLNQIKQTGRVIAFAAKWHGSRQVEFYSEYDFEQEKLTALAHNEMVGAAWRLLDEADIVVHWNGEAFDIPHLNREFAELGMAPPSPFKQIDLMKVARKVFRFTSNKLDHVAQQLGIGAKVHTGGFELWLGCMAGDVKSWRLMRRYNKQDVNITDGVYVHLKPWVPHHPHIGLYDGDMTKCGRCQQGKLQRRGYATTSLGKYQRYQCTNCGGWTRGKRNVLMADTRPT